MWSTSQLIVGASNTNFAFASKYVLFLHANCLVEIWALVFLCALNVFFIKRGFQTEFRILK